MLIDEGRLVRDGTSWRATGGVEQIRVPQSINSVLAARLDGLPDREKNVLQAASVVGQRVQLRQLQELAGGSDLDETVDSLRRKGLLVGGDGADDELGFRHLLIRDAAYGSLPKSERATLHDRFGTVLEQQAGDPQQLTEILAHHAEQAFTLSSQLGLSNDVLLSRGRRALDWSIALGDRARTRHELQVLESALSIIRSAVAVLPDGGGPEARARIRLLEAQLLVMKADYGDAGKAAAEAAVLAEDAGLLPLVATARLAEAWIHNWSGEGTIEDFARIVERAVDACRRAGDLPGEIEARHIGTNIQFALGDLAKFVELNERLVEQAQAIGDPAHEAAITARLVSVEHMRGNVDRSARHAAEAEALATRYGFRNVTLRLAFDRGAKQLFAGDLAEAEGIFRLYELAARDAGAVQHIVSALRHLGYTLVYAGKYAEAAQALDQALELSETSGERWNRSELFGLRARAALELADLESADTLIERALSSLRDRDITGISEVFDHLGLIRAAQGRDAEAEAALRRSLQVVAGTEYSSMQISAGLDLAKFLAERSRLDEAKVLCDEYAELAEQRGWKVWRPEISAIRRLITVGQPT